MNTELNMKIAEILQLSVLEPLPDYVGDIREAWKLMDKFKMYEPEVGWSDEEHCWHCIFWKGRNSGTAQAGFSAAHAICLAVLDSFL